MPSRRKNWRTRAVAAVLVALCVHVAAIGLFTLVSALTPPPKLPPPSARNAQSSAAAGRADEDRPLQIETIVDQLDRPDVRSAEEKLREEQAKKEQEDKNPHGQVVDIAKPTIESRPDKANYVAEYDSKVDKETKGPAGRDQAGGKAAMVPPTGTPDAKEPQAAQPGSTGAGQAKPGRPGPLAMRELERRRAQENRAEGPTATQDGELERAGSQGQHRPDALKPSPRAGEGGAPGDRNARQGRAESTPGLPGDRRPNLAVSPDVLQKAIGKGTGSMDYLKDVDDGDGTALNAKKWKHAPFFNRIKRSVANEWHPEVVYVRHDPSGNVYGVKDRVTVLRVHLQPDGKLAAWNVLQSSGVEFLDDEAIEAFRKAAPFPNPPKDLVEHDGQIHFNFAFIFELSGRGSLKVFKYQ